MAGQSPTARSLETNASDAPLNLSLRSNITNTRGFADVAGLHDVATSMTQRRQNSRSSRLGALALRSLGALGVVYGDIGTSPLYTLPSVYAEGEIPHKEDLMGCASCLVWTLTLVVVVKYILCAMRADYKGEGGIFALLLLIPKPAAWFLTAVACVGASMLVGDGMITPAMSVLSAFEGLDSGALKGKGLHPFIIPATVVSLLCLFAVQPFGIGKIGRAFGPIMVIYFVAVGGIGLNNIVDSGNWEVFGALNPIWVFSFFTTGNFRGWKAFWELGTFVLSVTGAEALYADLGHFGRMPILVSWFGLVYPALVLAYLGQAAFLMSNPSLVTSAFWSSVPHSLYMPMMVLVTMSTIIASQSLIAGCYSLINQAVVLGVFPRVRVVYTDSTNMGQLFIPEVMWMLGIGTLMMVFYFQTSAAMAGAYGIAVTGTFAMTDILFFAVTRHAWQWRLASAGIVLFFLLSMDLAFFVANIPKVLDGGWVPLAIGVLLSTMMLTWQWGQKQVEQASSRMWEVSLEGQVEKAPCSLAPNSLQSKDSAALATAHTDLEQPPQLTKVAGVFLLESPIPLETLASFSATDARLRVQALKSLMISTASLPQLCVLVAVEVREDTAFVEEQDRVTVAKARLPSKALESAGIYYVQLNVGFAEPLADLCLHELLNATLCNLQGVSSAPERATLPSMQLPVRYFLGHYKYRTSSSSHPLRKLPLALYRCMNTCCRSAVEFYKLPQDCVVLVGGIMDV